MDDSIQPYVHVAIRLPSDLTKIQQILPNTNISLGKFGTFSANQIIGRPYHLTWEILEKSEDRELPTLRVVPPSELYEDIEEDVDIENQEPRGEGDGQQYEVVNNEGKVVMRTNKNIMDDAGAQKLTMHDIEELKRADTTSGKDTIAKILESHTALDKKTAFSLAKYTLRKHKKYMKRFSVLPMDVNQLANFYLYEKDSRITMELREEILGLMLSWANVHCGGPSTLGSLRPPQDPEQVDHNRWLVVDETGGLIVAAMAERMNILYPTTEAGRKKPQAKLSHGTLDEPDSSDEVPASSTDQQIFEQLSDESKLHNAEFPTSNTITIIHPATQPNLSVLSYFSYDPSYPNPHHPLHTHLKSLSWLQLLHPEEDSYYHEPPTLSKEELAAKRSGKRSAYYRKRRRWMRVSSTVDETRAGGFAGLIVASAMASPEILHHCVPLLRGGAQVVVYCPTAEPAVELMDVYSTARRSAFLTRKGMRNAAEPGTAVEDVVVPSEEFPLDPTLLLGTAVHTSRARPWQVLPGRTHPLMMGKGGAEGYVFVGTRVLPAQGGVQARGQFRKKKKEGGDMRSETTAGEGTAHDTDKMDVDET